CDIRLVESRHGAMPATPGSGRSGAIMRRPESSARSLPMHRPALTTTLLSLALLTACGAGNGSAPATSVDASAGPAQVADAAPRESRGIGPFTAETIASFNEPWALSFLPDGRLLVSERPGALKLVDVASGRAGDVSGVPDVVYGGQGGFG